MRAKLQIAKSKSVSRRGRSFQKLTFKEESRSSRIYLRVQVAEKIKRHSESLGGLARFTFQIDNPGLTNKDLMDSYELIGKKVIPLVNKT